MTIEFTPEHIGAHDKVSFADEQTIIATAQRLAAIKKISLDDALLELGYKITEDENA